MRVVLATNRRQDCGGFPVEPRKNGKNTALSRGDAVPCAIHGRWLGDLEQPAEGTPCPARKLVPDGTRSVVD